MATSSRKPPKLSDEQIFAKLADAHFSLRYSIHALERLEERNILPEAVEQMLRGLTGRRFRVPRKDRFEFDCWKYVMSGEDLDGNIISVVIIVTDEEGIIVTVFKND